MVPANKESGLSFSQVIGRDHFAMIQGKSLQVYEVKGDGKPLYTLTSDNANDSMEIAAVTKDGEYIAVADDTSVALVETDGDGKPIFKITSNNANERFRPVSFVKNDSWLAVGRHNRTDKSPAKTQIYDTSGKLVHDLEFLSEESIKVSSDGKYIYSEFWGATTVMNIPDKKRLFISKAIYTPPTADTDANPESAEKDQPTPTSSLRFILKHRGDVTTVYDAAVGEELRVLFDPATVNYDKNSKVKKSGLADAFWAEDYSYIYALDDKRNKMLFWTVKE